MTDQRPTKRRGVLDWSLHWTARRSSRFWGISIILLPVVYVGSLEHVYRLLDLGLIPLWMEPPIVLFYLRVFWLIDD